MTKPSMLQNFDFCVSYLSNNKIFSILFCYIAKLEVNFIGKITLNILSYETTAF